MDYQAGYLVDLFSKLPPDLKIHLSGDFVRFHSYLDGEIKAWFTSGYDGDISLADIDLVVKKCNDFHKESYEKRTSFLEKEISDLDNSIESQSQKRVLFQKELNSLKERVA